MEAAQRTLRRRLVRALPQRVWLTGPVDPARFTLVASRVFEEILRASELESWALRCAKVLVLTNEVDVAFHLAEILLLPTAPAGRDELAYEVRVQVNVFRPSPNVETTLLFKSLVYRQLRARGWPGSVRSEIEEKRLVGDLDLIARVADEERLPLTSIRHWVPGLLLEEIVVAMADELAAGVARLVDLQPPGIAVVVKTERWAYLGGSLVLMWSMLPLVPAPVERGGAVASPAVPPLASLYADA